MFDRVKKGLYWDRAWTLVQGCTPVSPACDNCWSARETAIRSQHPNSKIRTRYEGLITDGHFNGKVRLREDNLELPLKVKNPTVWAIWNDLFHEKVSADFIIEAFEIMEYCKQHIFLVLTKRPQRIHHVLYGPEGDFYLGGGDYIPNVWIGTTVENKEQAEIRIPHLLKCDPLKLWLSIEPLLGFIRLYEFLKDISWVVCGCESGPNARFIDPVYMKMIRNDCISAGIPFFLKQMRIDGKLVKLPELDGKKWQELPRLQITKS